jgi:hypothetical protein
MIPYKVWFVFGFLSGLACLAFGFMVYLGVV